MQIKETLSMLVKKTTIANVVAGIAVLATLAFGIAVRSTEIVSLVGGAAIGYLFKTAGRTGEKTE
jgi:hypothetical protein